MIILSLCVIVQLRVVYGAGGCYPPFTNFLQCMKSETQSRIELFKQETTSDVQRQIRTCFSRQGCVAPKLNDTRISDLLEQPWSHRVSLLLDLFITSTPAVQDCMIDFFAEEAAKHVQTCIMSHGSNSAKHFTMPKLPKLENIDMKALQSSVISRLLVTDSMIQCSRRTPSDAGLQNLMDCVKQARSDNPLATCSAREKCKTKTIDTTGCAEPFESVERAACQCVKTEKDKLASGNFKAFSKIIKFFVQGELISKYEQCCYKTGTPVPRLKLDAVSKSIRDSSSDALLNGMPSKVRHLAAQLIMQIGEELQTVLCGACTSPTTANADARALRKLASVQARPNGDLFSSGIKGFLSGLLGRG